MRKNEPFIQNILLNVKEHSGKSKKNKIFPLEVNFSLVSIEQAKNYVGIFNNI